MSLSGFAVLGALGAALGAAGASSRKVLRRLRGQDEVRLGDAGVQLLAARAVATIRAMLARGRAAWSDLSRPRPNGVAGHARAETVKKVAVAIAGRIRERPEQRR